MENSTCSSSPRYAFKLSVVVAAGISGDQPREIGHFLCPGPKSKLVGNEIGIVETL